MFHLPNQYRAKHQAAGFLAGNEGAFTIPHHRIADYSYFVIASSGLGWEHISITLQQKWKPVKRCPTWEEMCFMKDMFWDPEDYAVQFHPPKQDHVSMHPYCLHIWRPTTFDIQLPNPLMVGINSIKFKL